MTTHKLKIWPDYFGPVLSGDMRFTVRLNDRGYQVGDMLQLQEYDDHTQTYTGREVHKRVTYLLEGIGAGCIAPVAGLHRGYVALSLGD